MQAKKIFLSVEKMSMCNISPAYEGIGVIPNCDNCTSYLVSEKFKGLSVVWITY